MSQSYKEALMYSASIMLAVLVASIPLSLTDAAIAVLMGYVTLRVLYYMSPLPAVQTRRCYRSDDMPPYRD